MENSKRIKKVRLKDCTKVLKLFNNNETQKIWEKIKEDFKDYEWDKAELQVKSPWDISILFENFRKIN